MTNQIIPWIPVIGGLYIVYHILFNLRLPVDFDEGTLIANGFYQGASIGTAILWLIF